MAKRPPIKVPDSSLTLEQNLEVLSHWAATYAIGEDAREPLSVEIDFTDSFFQVLEPLSEEIQAFGKAYQGNLGRAADEFQKLIQRNFRGSTLDSDTTRRLTGIATRLAIDTMTRYNYKPQSVHEGVAYLLNAHFWDDICSDARNIPGFNSHYNGWRAHVLNAVHLVGTGQGNGATLKFDSGLCDGQYYCANMEGKEDYTVHLDRLGMLSLSTQGASVLGNHEVFHAILTGDAVKYIQKWEPEWPAGAIHRRINCYEDVRVTAAGVNVTNDSKLRARHLYQAHTAFLVAYMKGMDPQDPDLHSNECFYLAIKEGLGSTVPYQCSPKAEEWLARNRDHILALADRQTIPVGDHGKMNYITRDARRQECALAAAEHLHALVAADVQEQRQNEGGQSKDQTQAPQKNSGQGKDGQQGDQNQPQPSQGKEAGQQPQASSQKPSSDKKEKGEQNGKPGEQAGGKEGQKSEEGAQKGEKSDSGKPSDGQGAKSDKSDPASEKGGEKKEGDSSKDAPGQEDKSRSPQGAGEDQSQTGQGEQGQGEKSAEGKEGGKDEQGNQQSKDGAQAGAQGEKGKSADGQKPGEAGGEKGSSQGEGQSGAKGDKGEAPGQTAGGQQPKAGEGQGNSGEAGGKEPGSAGAQQGQAGQDGNSGAGSPSQNGKSEGNAGGGEHQGAGQPGVGTGSSKPGSKGEQSAKSGSGPKDATQPSGAGKPGDITKPRGAWGEAPKDQEKHEATPVQKAAEGQKKFQDQQQNGPADLTPPPPADKPVPEISHEVLVFEKSYINSPMETLEREHGATIRAMTRLYQESMRNAKAEVPKPEARVQGNRLNMPGYLRHSHIDPEYEKIYERKPKDVMESEYTFHLVLDSSGSMYGGSTPTIKPAAILMSIQMLALLGAGHRSSLSAFAESGEGMIPAVKSVVEAAPYLKAVLARAMDGQRIHQGGKMGGGTEIYYSLRAPLEIIRQTKEISGPQAITVFSDGGVSNQHSSATEDLLRQCRQAKIPLIYACYPQVPPSISDIVGEQACVALPDLSLASCKKVHGVLLETMKRNKLLVDVDEGKRVIQEVKRLKYSPALQAGEIPIWKGRGR